MIAALRRDAEAMLPPVFAELVRTCAQPLFQPIGDLELPMMRHGRVALLGDAAFVARPHVAKGAIKAGHDAIELAAALADANVEDGLTRYDAVRRPASALVIAESVGSGPTSKAKASAPIPSPSCARMAVSRPQTGPTVVSSSNCWRKLALPDSARRARRLVGCKLEVTVRVRRERHEFPPATSTVSIFNNRSTSKSGRAKTAQREAALRTNSGHWPTPCRKSQFDAKRTW